MKGVYKFVDNINNCDGTDCFVYLNIKYTYA